MEQIKAAEMCLRVSATSHPSSVAGAIAAAIRLHGRCELSVIGAGAINQAVKAIAIARGFVASNGIDLPTFLSFEDLELDGEVRTAIKFVIKVLK